MQFETILFANGLSGFIVFMGFFLVLSVNFLIGVFEGTILFCFFRGRQTMPETPAWNGLQRWALFGLWLKIIFLMFIANLVSAFVGFLITPRWYLDNSPFASLLGSGRDISTFYSSFWGIIAFSALSTLVIELPFVYLCVAKGKNRFLRSMLGDLVIHLVSYPLLIGTLIFFNIFSFGAVIHNDINFVPANEISITPGVRVYYIGLDDRRVHCLKLDDRTETIVSEKLADDIFPCSHRLIWKQNEIGDQWALYLCDDYEEINSQLIDDSVGSLEELDISNDYDPTYGLKNAEQRFSEYLSPHDFRSESNRNPQFRMPSRVLNIVRLHHVPKDETKTSRLYSYSLNYGPSDSTEQFDNLSFRKPFDSLPLFAPNILPDNRVILQIGREICLFDYKTRRLAVLARGFGPVVAIERDKTKPSPAKETLTR